MDFEDSESKKEEKEDESSKKDSLSDNKEEKNPAQEEGDKKDDSELNAMESNLESSNDIDDSDEKEKKEINNDPYHQKIVQKNLLKEKYKTFTDEFDEIKNADELESETEISRLRKNLDQQLINLQSIVTKLANKLQRQLLAKQNRSWEFDLEEGMLDAAKLSRVVIDPFHSLSYKMEKERLH